MEQDQYVKVNIKESVRSQLKEQAKGAGKTLADYIEWLATQVNAAPAADALLEQLDTQSNDPYAQYRNLDDGELPECCQGIYSGLAKNRCEHWEWVNGGWKNKITNKYASDAEYVNYMENR